MATSKLKFTIFILLLVSFVFASQSSFSQEKWSLESCIKYALDNNLQIKQQQLNSQYSENTLTQSKAGILPNLNAGAEQSYSFGRAVDPYTYQFSDQNIQSSNYYIGSSVTLFKGLQNYNTVKKNELDLKSALQDMEKAKNDISLAIATAYLQILFSDEMVTIAKSQLEVTNQQIKRTEVLVNAGTLAKSNLYEIQSQGATEELQVINAENQLRSSYLTLIQFLELRDAQNFVIEKPEFPELAEEVTLLKVDEIYSKALGLPQIKSAELQMNSSERSLEIAKGAYYPQLSLNLNYGTGYSDARKLYIPVIGYPEKTAGFITVGGTKYDVYSPSYSSTEKNYPFSDQFKDNASTSISFRLSIPIFNGWSTQTQISNAKLGIMNSHYKVQVAKNQLFKEIQQSHSDAVAAITKYKASKKAVTAMEESFKYTQQKFDVGIVNTVDYHTAKTQLMKAKSDMLQAKYEYIFKKSILDFYAGNPIKL